MVPGAAPCSPAAHYLTAGGPRRRCAGAARPVADGRRLDELLARFDGLLLLGGGDIDPDRYGAAERDPSVDGVDADHDAFELAAMRAAVDLDLPVLAVCRGCQVLNVALGGTLRQHVDDHRGLVHPVAVAPGSHTEAAMGTTHAGRVVAPPPGRSTRWAGA